MLRADQTVEADETESEAAETDDDGAEVTDADA
jgi:hypothetical protein